MCEPLKREDSNLRPLLSKVFSRSREYRVGPPPQLWRNNQDVPPPLCRWPPPVTVPDQTRRQKASQAGDGKQLLTVCPIHDEPMKVRKGEFSIFTSHYLGVDASGKKQYCKGGAK